MIKAKESESTATILSIQQRNNHRKATNPGKIVSLHPRCKCCHLPYTKQSLKYSFSQQQIVAMGVGVLLYYRFLLLLMIIGLISSCSYSIVSLVQNIQKYQQQLTIKNSYYLTFKISNLSNVYYKEYISSIIIGILGILVLCFMPIGIKGIYKIVAFFYFCQKQFQFTQPLSLLFQLEKPVASEIDVRKTINDWYEKQKQNNVDLQNNPLSIIKNQEIQDNNIVEKIYFHFNLKHLNTLKKQIQLLQVETAKQQSFEHTQSLQITNKHISQGSQNKSQEKKKKIQEIKLKICQKQIQQTNKFIVVFKNFFYRQYFRTQLSNKYCNKNQNVILFPENVSATVKQAPYPNQIYYHIQDISYDNKKLKYRLYCWLFNIVVIGIGTVLQLIVLIIFKKYQVFSLNFRYFGLVVAVIFYFISELGSKLSIIFIQKEYHSNQSSKNYSKFMHIIITNIFLKCISISLMYQSSKIKQYWQSDLIETATWLILITALLLLITKIINIRILTFIYNRLVLEHKINKDLKQQQFNKLFQKPQNKIQQNYAEVVQLMLISFLYASIIPISLLIYFTFLLLYYLLQRLCFIYIYKQPQPSSDYLFLNIATTLWKILPLCITLGQFYYIYILYLYQKNVNHSVIILFIVIISLNVLIFFIPSSLFKVTITDNFSYQYVKQKVIICYSQYNPLYLNQQQQQTKRVRSIGLTKKSDQLQQQLNMMSRSLENTLKQKLFNIKNPCLQTLGNTDELSQIYFEYDKKISMPTKQLKKQSRYLVPPLFKIKKQQQSYHYHQNSYNNNTNQTADHQLVKLNTLVGFQSEKQGQKIKNIIKGAIRLSINKIQ